MAAVRAVPNWYSIPDGVIQSKFIEIRSRSIPVCILIIFSWMKCHKFEDAIVKMIKTDFSTLDAPSLDNYSAVTKYSKTVQKFQIILLTILVKDMELDK